MWEPIWSWIWELITDPVGFFSVIFSGALVALYRQQWKTQSRQRELMAIEQEPEVLVDGFRGGTEDRGGMESLEIKLSNIGRNAATGLKLNVESGFHEDSPFLGGTKTETLETADFNDDDSDEIWRAAHGGYLEPQERGAEFIVYDIPIRWSNEDDHYDGILSLSHLREELSDYEKPNAVRLSMSVEYEDHEDEKQVTEVFDYVLPLCDEDGDGARSLKWMLENSEVMKQDYPLASGET